MSQIPCKQSTRIEMTGWFKHYFPGNLRRNLDFCYSRNINLSLANFTCIIIVVNIAGMDLSNL